MPARTSPLLYTRCPKPMIRVFLANASRSHVSAFSGEPAACSVSMTRSFAPPCSGPFKAPTAPTIAECKSDSESDHASGECRGVEIVLGVKDQRQVKRLHL